MKYKISEFAAQSFGEVRKEDHAKGLHQNLGNWGLQQGERHPYGMGGLRQAAASLPYKGLIQHTRATWEPLTSVHPYTICRTVYCETL